MPCRPCDVFVTYFHRSESGNDRARYSLSRALSRALSLSLSLSVSVSLARSLSLSLSLGFSPSLSGILQKIPNDFCSQWREKKNLRTEVYRPKPGAIVVWCAVGNLIIILFRKLLHLPGPSRVRLFWFEPPYDTAQHVSQNQIVP